MGLILALMLRKEALVFRWYFVKREPWFCIDIAEILGLGAGLGSSKDLGEGMVIVYFNLLLGARRGLFGIFSTIFM